MTCSFQDKVECVKIKVLTTVYRSCDWAAVKTSRLTFNCLQAALILSVLNQSSFTMCMQLLKWQLIPWQLNFVNMRGAYIYIVTHFSVSTLVSQIDAKGMILQDLSMHPMKLYLGAFFIQHMCYHQFLNNQDLLSAPSEKNCPVDCFTDLHTYNNCASCIWFMSARVHLADIHCTWLTVHCFIM